MKEEFTELDDERLRAALHGVELPSGLRERIRSRLRSTSLDDAPAESHESGAPASGVSPVPGMAITDRSGQSSPGLASSGLASPSLASPGLASPSLASPSLAEPKAAVVSSRNGRHRLLWLAMAVSLAGLLFGYYRSSRPLLPDHLANYCIEQLDRLSTTETAWRTPDDGRLADLSVLKKGRLKLDARPLGFLDRSGGPFAERCRIWELHSLATQKRFYVFDFHDAVSVQSLTGQLLPIQQVSGRWSLVAMRSGDRLLVVAFQGPLDSYLHRPQAA